ncbi:gephyrin-like molybdotransferase Glp [Methanorbis furvi]|uniref:Molybdopterin molybdenumtransferase n=1 Tax=Methanorbis furvi TaxID=3028299 RepID=A0AAE4MD83_9EURY|nr:Molybdopterin molybdenumtransferase [Methanocorpusculaceae archaeon Ag1]
MRFLRLQTAAAAEEALLALTKILPEELIPLDKTCGRILSCSITAPENIPGFDRSVKDGYAVRSADTLGAAEQKPKILRLTGKILMGQNNSGFLDEKTAKYIPTGGVMPEGADAVVMQESAELAGDLVMIKTPVNPGADVLGKDEDFAKDQNIFPAGTKLTAQAAGVLAAFGIDPVPVIRQPKIGIISTGNELIAPNEKLELGKIRDTNSTLLQSFVIEAGGIPAFYGIIPDIAEALKNVLERAVAECDAVILSGGSSKDERDVTANVIAELGTIHVHGVSIAPGKPTIIGSISGKPILGLPGHPASTYMIATVFAKPMIQKMTGDQTRDRIVPAKLSMSFPSEKGREDLIRIKILPDGSAEPVLGKSGLLNTLIHSDGYIRIPAGLDGCEAGETVEVHLWQ